MVGRHNKIALITGAGSGIGRAVSIALLKGGYSVALCGRSIEPLRQTVATATANDDNSLCVSCDVGNVEHVKSMFAQIESKFKRIDLLFNNAGGNAPPVLMEDLTYQQWQAVVDVNLTGPFLCAQQAIKLMKTQSPSGGRIINNGSISAHAPRPFSAPYTATKHAITGLTKSISLDCRDYNITCGQIDIGNVATPMTERMQKGVPQANGTIEAEPTFDLEHVAQAVLQMDALPLDTNVLFMTIMANKMPFVGRG